MDYLRKLTPWVSSNWDKDCIVSRFPMYANRTNALYSLASWNSLSWSLFMKAWDKTMLAKPGWK